MPRLGITCGDPAGVGPEIIAAWLRGLRSPSGKFFIIGPAQWLASLPKRPNVRLVPVGDAAFRITPGRPSAAGARLALAAMETAAQGARDGRWDAVVTGPVSKAELARVGFKHPGQTEFFAARWGGEPVMAFVGAELRVALATWHIPLAAPAGRKELGLSGVLEAHARELRLAHRTGHDGIPAPITRTLRRGFHRLKRQSCALRRRASR
jgi:4-hydroxythreonine-4-phosphate dehydrogenase